MKPRAKLGLTVLVGLLPIGGAFVWAQAYMHRGAFEEGVVESVISRMAEGGRERCEADPARFDHPPRFPGHRGRGHRRRPPGEALFVYGADLRSMQPRTPPLDPELAAQLRAGARYATRPAPHDEASVLYAIRMPWQEGPCAVVALRRGGAPRPAHLPLALFLLSALAAGLAVLAGGPVVRRIRRLTHAIADAREGESPVLDLGGTDEVADLARAFHAKQQKLLQQMEELQRRDRALSEHLANTMHDVMIPLTVLEGHLMGLRGRSAADADRGDPVLAAAIEETHYIATLMTNLDAWARLDAGDHSLAHERVDLGLLVERVVARHQPVARERGVELAHAVPDEPVTSTGDETLLERAVGNLVHNAVRHNRRGGHVAVTLESTGAGFELRVLDDGPGMTPDDAQRMLARGVAKDIARSRAGHGLGLSIIARAAQLHGLRLEFRHPDAGGLEVVLTPDAGAA